LLRVIAGELRGRRLATAPGRVTRPTSDRVRESLFGLLGSSTEGARVLDLFAGSGALGIEALSRGAAHAVFVERSAPALRALRANVVALDLSRRCTVRAEEALAAMERDAGWFDLVLADPPYAEGLEARIVESAARRLAPGGILALEHSARTPAPPAAEGLAVWKSRRYGDTMLTLYVRVVEESS
jgi:16S rRNA (guanine966-N2)-methyltransferase